MTTKSRGFTIIEVMIVLAVGGMIMLIIFQAIPTLLRNGRNGQRKHDVSAVLEAVSHYELNNSGNFPGSTSDFLHFAELNHYDRTVHYDPGTPPTSTDTGIFVYSLSSSATPPSVSPVTNDEYIAIYKYQKCLADSSGGSTGTGAGYYDTVALYAVETASGVASQCEQL